MPFARPPDFGFRRPRTLMSTRPSETRGEIMRIDWDIVKEVLEEVESLDPSDVFGLEYSNVVFDKDPPSGCRARHGR